MAAACGWPIDRTGCRPAAAPSPPARCSPLAARNAARSAASSASRTNSITVRTSPGRCCVRAQLHTQPVRAQLHTRAAHRAQLHSCTRVQHTAKHRTPRRRARCRGSGRGPASAAASASPSPAATAQVVLSTWHPQTEVIRAIHPGFLKSKPLKFRMSQTPVCDTRSCHAILKKNTTLVFFKNCMYIF